MLDIVYSTDAQPPKYRSSGASRRSGDSRGMLSEDYAEIVDEEGDYSTPASEFTLPSEENSKINRNLNLS